MALPSTGLGTCANCLKPIRWTRTAKGRRQAVNPDPDDAGNIAAFCDGLGIWRSRVPTTALPQAAHERRFMPHVATCAPRQPTLPPPAGVASLAARRRTKRRGGTR